MKFKKIFVYEFLENSEKPLTKTSFSFIVDNKQE